MIRQVFKTVCGRDCYDSCFLQVELDEHGEIVSVKGDPENPVTDRAACPKGAKERIRVSSNRILYPHLRKGNDLVRVTWDEALDTVAAKLQDALREHGPGAVLYLDFDGNTGMLNHIFQARIWNALGVTKTDYSLCSRSGREGLSYHYGLGYGIQPDELPDQRLIIFWGFNPGASAMHLLRLALKARERGARLAVVDTRYSETARHADIWLNPRPGSDVAVAYGIARHIIMQGKADLDFIGRFTAGYEQFREEAMKWTPERVEQASGIKGSAIEELGNAYCSEKPSATLIGIGFQKSLQGAESVRAVSLLPALIGLHRGFYYSNSSCYIIDEEFLSGASLSSHKSKTVSQVGLGDLMKEGVFKFTYVNNMNPAASIPNQKAFREGLSRRDSFLTVHDTHWTETARMAGAVLPAPTYLEKEDLIIPWCHRYVRLNPKILKSPGESREELEVMVELSRRLGLREEWLYGNPWEAIEHSLRDAFEGGTFADLRAGKTLKLKMRAREEYQTPGGRISFASDKAAGKGYSPLPVMVEQRVGEGEFILLSSALPNYTHTQFREVFGPIPPIVRINSSDAERMGISGGDRVSLINDRGAVTFRAEISTDLRPGVLWAPKHSTGLNEEPLNLLIPPETQAIGGGPVINSTIIRQIVRAAS